MSHRSVPLSTHLPGPQSCHKITWIVCKNVAPDLSPSIHPGIAKQQRLVSLQNSKTAKQRNSGQSRLAQGTCRGRPTLLHFAALRPKPTPHLFSQIGQGQELFTLPSVASRPNQTFCFFSPVSHLHLLWIGTIVSLQLKLTPHPQPPIRIGTLVCIKGTESI